MELIRGLHNVRAEHRGCAITIGNFDGVHLGHQAVLRQLAARARVLGVPTLAMIFEPQPREYFQPHAAPARLMRLREKLLALRTQLLDRVLCVRFDSRFAAMTPETFIEHILLDQLGARYVLVGEDFRFGHKRAGTVEMLARAGQINGFEVASARTYQIGGERVSSTRVRAALAAGDLQTATELLGRAYRMCGRVVHGNKVGREIGVPTANIELQRNRAPLAGIFVVELSGVPGEHLPGVASLGVRPTVNGSDPILEVHLLDLECDLYGHYVAVDFLHKLRDEQRFDSIEAMRLQILRDIDVAKGYFRARDTSLSAALHVSRK